MWGSRLLIYGTVVMALFQQLHMVTPPVQSYIEPVEAPLCMQPSVFIPAGASQMQSLRNRLIAYHEPRGKPNAAWLNIMRSRRKHIPGAHHSIPIRLDTCGVVYIIYNRTDPKHHLYVGLTHKSAWHRMVTHIHACKAYLRRPAAARKIYNKAHGLYRKMGQTGLKDWAIFPIEKLPDVSCSSRVFARRYAHREAFWIDTKKTLCPRGYNIRNGRPSRRAFNRRKHQQIRLQGHLPAPMLLTTSSAINVGVHGTAAMPGILKHSSSARTAHAFLREVEAGDLPLPQSLSQDHPIVLYLSPMRLGTLNQMLAVLNSYSLEQLNNHRTLGAQVGSSDVQPFREPAWSVDRVQLVIAAINAHIEFVVRDNSSVARLADKQLLVVKYSYHAIDEVALGRRVNDPLVLSSIPVHLRKKIGRPLVAFKYDTPIGVRWGNTRAVARLSESQLHAIRTSPCHCHQYAAKFKVNGHLRTSEPSILPDEKLPQICTMGAKFRPSAGGQVLDASTRVQVFESIAVGVKEFARKAEQRAGVPHCMAEWQSLVLAHVQHDVDSIPDDTLIRPVTALSYTDADDLSMKNFLTDKVCTTMDKAAGTMVFCCKKDYIARCEEDLQPSAATNPVYSLTSLSQDQIVQESNAFTARFGFDVDHENQDIPFYKGIEKMHKDPPDTRFISSSSTSHMKRISLFLTYLFNALIPGLDTLFRIELLRMNITAQWASRSWILKDTAAMIPLLRVWNTQYAQHNTGHPHLEACDFQRLYTAINTADMKLKIMSLVTMIFNLPEHVTAGHVGIKVWETKPAVWLKAGQIPAHDYDRSGSGHGGQYMIFDLHIIEGWLYFLLDNMYVRFGDSIWRQVQGTPMGTNCAPHLANMYLSKSEHAFVQRLADIYTNALLFLLHTLVYQIACAYLLTSRFLDDLASINNPYLHELMYEDQHYVHASITGIYPRTLLVSSADSGTSINYMDITIQPEQNSLSRLTTVLYDKREHAPLKGKFIVKFPHASSQISATAKYGIITSQFHRLRRIILSGGNFTFRMGGIIHYMTTKGHDAGRMLGQVKGMCKQFPELYGRDAWRMAEDVQQAFLMFAYRNSGGM